MPGQGPERRRLLLEEAFAALAARDVDAALAHFAENAVMIDPHYPQPRMEGRQAIEEGLRWALAGMESMGFVIDTFLVGDDGTTVAAEVSTHHVVRMGQRRLDFPQVFVVEFEGDLVRRMQAYEPYGPPGLAAVFIGLSRLRRRLRRRR